jgi:hypothetical protein
MSEVYGLLAELLLPTPDSEFSPQPLEGKGARWSTFVLLVTNTVTTRKVVSTYIAA